MRILLARACAGVSESLNRPYRYDDITQPEHGVIDAMAIQDMASDDLWIKLRLLGILARSVLLRRRLHLKFGIGLARQRRSLPNGERKLIESTGNRRFGKKVEYGYAQ